MLVLLSSANYGRNGKLTILNLARSIEFSFMEFSHERFHGKSSAQLGHRPREPNETQRNPVDVMVHGFFEQSCR